MAIGRWSWFTIVTVRSGGVRRATRLSVPGYGFLCHCRDARTIPGFTWVELLLSKDDADELRDRGDLGLDVDRGAVSLNRADAQPEAGR